MSALVSDAATSRDGSRAERTPLCLMVGQGHQHFLSRLASIPREEEPRNEVLVAAKPRYQRPTACAKRCSVPGRRPDRTDSFRWDPHEDVRYALRARDPTDAKTKETTQHGANRLASLGLSVLTVVPQRRRGGYGWRSTRRPCVEWRICPLLADMARSDEPRRDSVAARSSTSSPCRNAGGARCR